MVRRSGSLLTWLSFGSAILLAGMGALSLAGALDSSAGWVLLLGSAALFSGGVASMRVDRNLMVEADRRLKQLGLLEAQIESQRHAVDSLADGLDVAIFMCDMRGSVQYANRRAVEMFQFTNPVGRSILAVTLSHELEQVVLSVAQHKEERNAEIVFTYPDERVGLAKGWNPTDAPNRVFLSIYEITDLRRLERVRQDFVANVSHELRTPMTIIRAMAETMLDEDDPEPPDGVRRYLSKIIDAVDRLSTIAQDLLVLSAAESNPVRKQACDIAEVFESVIDQLRMSASEKGLTLSYTGPDSLMIEANASQMTQVALNLVQNAINYTNAGRIDAFVEADGPSVQVRVQDTGMGIASEHLPRIFERFYRVDKARSRVAGGTGLGLSIVKHIVEAHGGKVTVTSALNQGSTFALTLPVGSVTTPGA